MAGLCEGGNEPPGSVKAIFNNFSVNRGQEKRKANEKMEQGGSGGYALQGSANGRLAKPEYLEVERRETATAVKLLAIHTYVHGIQLLGPWSHNAKILVSQIGQILISITGGTDGPALRPIEIYCANPRYGMSCMPQIPYAHRPNHMTALTTGTYSRQNPYTIPASATSSKAPLSVRGETPPPSRSASGAIAEAIQRRLTTFHGGRLRESAASGGRL
ncbi:hypothetical protein ANN_05943 [Periplaneta americana]|uniref:Uncharacterized protein n=1 Tax=Periplaneta americana TaxID=6978 RepID=A0ABQ8TDY9_PERAM|nr:hypothetical protein ANN_05943 [Periplaneta americana]